mmetsp:Transcript_7296/g.21016  ORF Transcript_7296/g.21016 Transcript_7296/m.21016 type:complete len:235 (-) Transcript_7296:1115-1819(-)
MIHVMMQRGHECMASRHSFSNSIILTNTPYFLSCKSTIDGLEVGRTRDARGPIRCMADSSASLPPPSKAAAPMMADPSSTASVSSGAMSTSRWRMSAHCCANRGLLASPPHRQMVSMWGWPLLSTVCIMCRHPYATACRAARYMTARWLTDLSNDAPTTTPLLCGSAKGERFPCTSGVMWMSFVRTVGQSSPSCCISMCARCLWTSCSGLSARGGSYLAAWDTNRWSMKEPVAL